MTIDQIVTEEQVDKYADFIIRNGDFADAGRIMTHGLLVSTDTKPTREQERQFVTAFQRALARSDYGQTVTLVDRNPDALTRIENQIAVAVMKKVSAV